MVKLGRKARVRRPGVPHLSMMLAGRSIPVAPTSADYTKGLPVNLGAMLNNELGDCTCAAFYHALQVWSNLSNPPIETEPDSNVELLYEQACGYVPDDEDTDTGGIEQDVLTYLLNTGAPVGPNGSLRHKIAGFVEVDPRNVNDVKLTIAECGLAYIGFNVPSFVMSETAPNSDWAVQPGPVDIIGGHAVILVGYNLARATVISWGQFYTMTWEFFAQYVDEVYGIIDPLWVGKGGKTPYGLTESDTESAMQLLKQAA